MKKIVLTGVLTTIVLAGCAGTQQVQYADHKPAPVSVRKANGASPWTQAEAPALAEASVPEGPSEQERLKAALAEVFAEGLTEQEPSGPKPETMLDALLLPVPEDARQRREAAIERFQPLLPLVQGEGTIEDAAQALVRYQQSQDAAALREAITYLEQHVTRYPGDERARLYLARAYRLSSRLDADSSQQEIAIEHLRRLVYLNASDPVVWVDFARALEDYGRREAAAYAWEQAARSAHLEGIAQEGADVAKQSTALFVRASRAYAETGLFARALMMLSEAEAAAQNDDDRALVRDEREWLMWDAPNLEARLLYDRALDLLAQDDSTAKAQAQNLFERLATMVHRRRARYDVVHGKALALHHVGRTDEAIDALRPVVASITAEYVTLPDAEDNPDGRIVRDYGAMLLAEAQRLAEAARYSDALAHLAEAGDLHVEPLSSQAYIGAARLLQSQPEEALAMLDRVNVDALDDRAEYLRVRAQTLRAAGRLDEARVLYEQLRNQSR